MDVAGLCAWRGLRGLFPLAAGALCAGTDACGIAAADDQHAPAWPEVEQVVREMALLGDLSAVSEKAPVALLVDPASAWVDDIERQGAGYRYPAVVFQYYGALRALGLDVDILPAGDVPLDGYKLIVAPTLAMPDETTVGTLRASDGLLLFGPRSGAKTQEFSISDGLPPGSCGNLYL